RRYIKKLRSNVRLVEMVEEDKSSNPSELPPRQGTMYDEIAGEKRLGGGEDEIDGAVHWRLKRLKENHRGSWSSTSISSGCRIITFPSRPIAIELPSFLCLSNASRTALRMAGRISSK